MFSQGHIPWSYPRPPSRVFVRSPPLSPTQRCHSINIGLACASSNYHFDKTMLASLKNVLILPLRKKEKCISFPFILLYHFSSFQKTAFYITIIDSSSPLSSSACSHWPLSLLCLLFSRSPLPVCLMQWSFLSSCHTWQMVSIWSAFIIMWIQGYYILLDLFSWFMTFPSLLVLSPDF